MAPLLETREVVVTFGGNRALDGVSITVGPGAVTGLIGPNGAGKTTLFNVVTGLCPPTRGRVLLDGTDITHLAPHRRARKGMARTFQRLELFTSLTVRDNIRVAGEIRNSWRIGGKVDVGRETDRVLALVGLDDVADQEVSGIPTGRGRVVELARALMSRPALLLLDEPASGLTEAETVAFGALLRRLADDGLGICLVEHDMSLVMQVSEVVHVLDHGAILTSGTPGEVRADQRVIDAYLGPQVVAP